MKEASIANIYRLDGRVPLGAAIPFGLQHVLAMFVANLTPIVIIAGAAGFDKPMTAMLVQNAMFVAGIATLVQLYPLWRVGARLPIVMGVSFTFVTAICFVAANFGYGAVVGAVLVGGVFEGTLGLLAKYWRRFISPIVSSIVVTTIGFSLLGIGIRSFGGGYNDGYGSWENLFLGTVTLVTCLLFSSFAKGHYKQMAVLVGLIVGYIVACALGKVDLSAAFAGNVFALPAFLPVAPEFNLGAIISVGIIFLVSAAETIGDTTAMAVVGLKRDIKEREISGSLACDGFCSSVASLFGCSPITSFSQNVGLIAMTKVVNRFAIMTGAVAMIIAGMFPPIGAFFASLPDAVLGGCTIMMFGSIMVSGIQMMSRLQMTQRNVTIAALSFSLGIGTTTASENAIWHVFPQVVQDVFSGNCVAVVYVVAILLDTFLPANMEVEQEKDEEEVLEPAIDHH
ncbi:nucleobase:cation symporter-2, NCS2 family [Selenomonas ruminantium]|uniref:Nucleobase:cation symporter-2, NCS2 family n=1 Tax=Selenomonas ruminantium TaxID=971 RepID=A0A1M6SQP9_SELRU|nr:nucleobase:cation symporter-2 family protein [Selenomonas ruminantium]SHK47074.1 nucleobase:cation symporter-2, NCS2 family [Selenomonas ruminantium]